MAKKSVRDEFLEKFVEMFNTKQLEALEYERKYCGVEFKITIEKL